MTFTLSTAIGITIVAMGFLTFMMYLNNKDQAKTIKSLELQVSQLEEQNDRVIKRLDEYTLAYNEMEKDYRHAVTALKVCEVKLHD